MNALWTLGKLAAKPSDKKIRLTRIIFAVLLILVITFGIFATDVNISLFDIVFLDIPYDEYILPILYIFPIIGLIRGIFDPGIFKKSVWKQVIMGLGATMMIFSVFFLSEKPYISPVNTETEIINAETLNNQQNDIKSYFSVVSTDNWLFFFGIITLIVGFALNGKNLTTKNEKFGETIKKIRV